MDALQQASTLLGKKPYGVLCEFVANPLELHDRYTKEGYRSLPEEVRYGLERLLITRLAMKGGTHALQ